MSRTAVFWASRVLEASAGINPETLLGQPDGLTQTFNANTLDMFVKLGDFRGRFYSNLEDLLSRRYFGDPVSPADLASAHVIAFEENGGSPAPSGGWESCDWVFSDDRSSYTVRWDERAGAPRDPAVLANGSLRGADYSPFFGIATDDSPVISYLLFRLPPTLDPLDPSFTVQIRQVPPGLGNEASPDVDAVGVIACHMEK